MKSFTVLLCLATLGLVSATVYFKEEFGSGWEKRWVESYPKKAEGAQGKWGWTAGKHFGDEAAEKGLQTSEDARFYDISAKFPKFSNRDKTLVVQYSVKHEQNIDCGGAYLKLLPASTDQANFGPDSKYYIMFGPDICGTTRKVHLIFHHNGENHLLKKQVSAESDTNSHLYTMVVKPDNTYEILVDEKSVASGSLTEDWDILPPKKIPDPKAKKPADWVDEKEIADPTDKKPAGWDDIPATIKDPNAKKPDDWDDELDGEWEAPTIDNPDYKGEWSPKMIPNPAYKGEWVHPQIDNPDYKEDPYLYAYDDFGVVGFELWQVKAGTIFDNIIIADSLDEVKELGKLTAKAREAEKKAQEAEQKAKEAAEAEKKEEAADEHAGHDHGKDEL